MTPIDKLLIPSRFILTLVMIFHAFGKFAALDTFTDKFGLPAYLGVLAGTAELLAAFGMALGVAVNGKFGTTITVLAGIAILSVQIPALFLVHFGGFFYFSGGMEYNLVLIVLTGTIMVGVLVSYRQKHPRREVNHDSKPYVG